MADSTSIPIIVQGNSFNLAIPLQIYVIDDGTMVLQDYDPDPTDTVTIQLKGSRRNYTYTPTISDNVATIALSGDELADIYGVVVTIVKADTTRLRSFRTDQFFIVESSDDLTPDDIIEGLEDNVIYLNSQCFVAGEDGRGIVSIVKTATAGLVDTYTITYTDSTTSTFNVTNGSDATQVQSDWSQSDSTKVDYIKNKPTIPAAQVQSNWNESNTSSKAYIQNKPTIPTIPATATQSEISVGGSTEQRTFTPQLFHDNAYIVEESYSSGSLKANRIYDFGTVSTALTIPSLDATNDLVSNALNFYALRFIAGADNLSITFPTGVLVDDTPTINTGDYVEIMINLYVVNSTNKFYASIKVWPAQ